MKRLTKIILACICIFIGFLLCLFGMPATFFTPRLYVTPGIFALIGAVILYTAAWLLIIDFNKLKHWRTTVLYVLLYISGIIFFYSFVFAPYYFLLSITVPAVLCIVSSFVFCFICGLIILDEYKIERNKMMKFFYTLVIFPVLWAFLLIYYLFFAVQLAGAAGQLGKVELFGSGLLKFLYIIIINI